MLFTSRIGICWALAQRFFQIDLEDQPGFLYVVAKLLGEGRVKDNFANFFNLRLLVVGLWPEYTTLLAAKGEKDSN